MYLTILKKVNYIFITFECCAYLIVFQSYIRQHEYQAHVWFLCLYLSPGEMSVFFLYILLMLLFIRSQRLFKLICILHWIHTFLYFKAYQREQTKCIYLEEVSETTDAGVSLQREKKGDHFDGVSLVTENTRDPNVCCWNESVLCVFEKVFNWERGKCCCIPWTWVTAQQSAKAAKHMWLAVILSG